MDVRTLSEERYFEKNRVTEKNLGTSQTDGGLAIIERYLSEYTKLVEERLPELSASRGAPSVSPLSAEFVALVGLSAMVNQFGVADETLAGLTSYIGSCLDDERYGWTLRNWDELEAKRIEDIAKKRSRGSVRRKVVRAMARKRGFKFTPWTNDERIKVGTWLYGVMVSGPVFFIDDGDNVCVSESAMAVYDGVVKLCLTRQVMHQPLKTPPEPWSGPSTVISTYHTSLVHSRHKVTQKVIEKAFEDGSIGPTLKSVNLVQSVPWVINRPVLELVEWCYENCVGAGKLPRRDKVAVPDRLGPDATPEAVELRKKAARDIHALNRKLAGKRVIYLRDIATANWVKDGEFYIPSFIDYRGRIYGISSFNFQKADYVRALFKFRDGKPLGERGLYWLKVHCANSWAQDGLDKKPFDDRAKWVDDNMDFIRSVAFEPKEELTWTKADKPFAFFAACLELFVAETGVGLFWDSMEDYKSNLPVSFDGSCNGLQHYAALMLDEETANHVNLVSRSIPGDIYSEMARNVEALVKLIPDTDPNQVARDDLLAYGKKPGALRKLFKRSVMTHYYSGKPRGKQKQFRTDTLEDYSDKMTEGLIDKHPFGSDWWERRVDKFLTTVSIEALKRTTKRPEAAMDFLKEVAKRFGQANKEMVWRTPLGFPVCFIKPQAKSEQILLFLNDRGVRRRIDPRLQVDMTTISTIKMMGGVAPNFIHSMDATHLHMVVLAAERLGITQLALVHDSFGCLPGDAEVIRGVLKQEFHNLYVGRNWLEDLLSILPPSSEPPPLPPERGSYNIADILNAEFAFS